MKYFTLVLILFSLNVFAGFPPTTIKGDKTSKKETFFDLEVPNKQATKISANKYRIETGNGNMLPDPSFESGVLPSNAVPTTAGEYGVACEGSGTRGIETNALANDGTKVLKLMYGAGVGVGVGRCGIYFKVPDNLIGTNVELSFTGAVKYGTTICARSMQSASPFATQDGNCLTTNDDVADKNKSFVFSITPIYDVVYLYFTKPNDDTATGTYRQAYIDTIHIGKPKSDEAIVAKFDNTTGWIPCTFSTLSWGGYGTVTNNLECKRDKDSLKIRGNFVNGTVSGSNLFFPMPTNFGVINAVKNSANYSVGNNFRANATQFSLQNYFVNSTVGDNNIYSSGSIIAAAVNPMVNVVGTGNVSTGERIVINGELTIPISEWSSHMNGAFVACTEGPFKCYDDFTTHITTTSGVIDSTKNTPVIAPWFTSCTAANPTVCTINPAFNLINPLSCDADYLGSGSGQAYIAQVVGSTTTQVSIVTFASTNGANVASLKFKLSCSKVDGDRRNPNNTVTPMSDMNDVKSTEWGVGWNHIDSKPIYKRCYKVPSDITSSGSVVTWPASLNPIDVPNTYLNQWILMSGGDALATANTYYDRATGIVSTAISGGTKLGANTTLCMKYVK